MRNKTIIVIILSFFCATAVIAQTFGTKKRMPRPAEFGNVILNTVSEDAGMAPVVFTHWLHRVKYTCRLCHVDLGFAMEAGQTGFTEEDNRNGMYCGACHDGKTAFASQQEGRDKKVTENCDRCHSLGKKVDYKADFYSVVKGFPRARFGNKVDWLKAEEQGLLNLTDYLEGISIRRSDLNVPVDASIHARVKEMPDIIFSHQKHAVWNGCELCHPQIFGIKNTATVYTMQDIFDGKFCGACHGKVAFMNLDCQGCHSKPVF